MRKIHQHIGAGSDPVYFLKSQQYILDMIETQYPDVEVFNVGGGFKVARGDLDKATDVSEMAASVLQLVDAFNAKTGRHLKLEIEPGTFLVANCGVLISEVIDKVTTKKSPEDAEGRNFLKLNTGLNEVTRPALYGAQHSIKFLSASPVSETEDFVIVGHCCESGDLITCAPGNSDEIRAVPVAKSVAIGDLAVLKGTGAYCSAMSLKNYNSFPEAAEVLIRAGTGALEVIRHRQAFDTIVANEVDVIKGAL